MLPEYEMMTRLLALLLAQHCHTQEEAIDLLTRAGLKPTLIAEILGTTLNTVNVSLSRARKHKKTRGRFIPVPKSLALEQNALNDTADFVPPTTGEDQ